MIRRSKIKDKGLRIDSLYPSLIPKDCSCVFRTIRYPYRLVWPTSQYSFPVKLIYSFIMKKYLLSLGLVVAFAFYALLSSNPGSTSIIASQPATSAPSTSGTTSNTQATTQPNNSRNGNSVGQTIQPATTPVPAPQNNAAGAFRNGSYTGPITDAYYGNVQVQAIVKNGALTGVQFLQYPSDQGTSRRTNNEAMPQLIQEAIQAQSANVNVVSGATQTSEAFTKSLAAALAMAK